MNRKYLLDTSIVVDVLRQKRTLDEILPADAETHLCDVVAGELLYGAQRSVQSDTQLALVRRFIAQYAAVSTDLQVAEIYYQSRSQSSQKRVCPITPSLRFPPQAGGTEPTRPTRFPSRSGGNLKEGGNCKLCPCDWYKNQVV